MSRCLESLRTPLLAAETPDAAVSQQGDDAAAGDGTQTNPAHKAALRAGSMLGQICERSLIEHQLAASHFAVLNFCEHAPGSSPGYSHRTQRAIALH